MIYSGFFNSFEGDRTYNADDISNYIGMFYTDGIANGLDAYPSGQAESSTKIELDSGEALVNNKYIISDSVIEFIIPSNNTNSDREDYIYAYCDESARECGFAYSTGESDLDTSTYVTVLLYKVTVRANTSYIQQSDIEVLNKVGLKVKTLEQLKKLDVSTTLSEFSVINSSRISYSFNNSVMADHISRDIGYFKVYISGTLQKSSYYTLTASGNTVTLNLNTGSYVYARENNNFGQDIVIEHVYLDIDT